MVEHEAREVEKKGAVILKEMSKKRDGSARELREVATSTRQLVMVREKKAAAPTWRLLLGNSGTLTKPVSNLKNSPEIVQQFHASHPSAPHHLWMAQADFASLFSMMPGNLCDPFPTFCHLESNT